jgi:hypothetical protein
MIYILVFCAVMATVLYIAIKDRGVRVTKYFMFLILALFCLHLYNIRFEFNFAAFFVCLFLADEWISLIPKIEKFNRMKLMGKQGYSLAEYSTLLSIAVGYEFNFTEGTVGVKTAQEKDICKFTFTSVCKGNTKTYVKDFDSIFKVVKGEMQITTIDTYGQTSMAKYIAGETIHIGAYTIHSMQSITEELIVDFIATK